MKIPTAVPNLEGNEAKYLSECVTSTFVSSVGPFVDRFAQQIAQESGVISASVVSSGTVALQLALEALGVGEGDVVIVPSLTFIATANAVRHTGADVWIVDVCPENWALDLTLLREVILSETVPTEQGRRHKKSGKILRAMVPVMIMGATLPFGEIAALGRDFDLLVVIDAAAAIGARGAGDIPLGRTGCDAVCYSFNGNKTVTCGGGGAIASANEAMITRINHLASTGRVGPNYDHDVVGYNFRMTNVQAALGVAQMERLDAFLDAKRHIHEVYDSLCDRFSWISPFPSPTDGRHTFWFSGFYYNGQDRSVPDAFRLHMNEAGIDLRKFWKPIHLQVPYQKSLSTRMDVVNDLWERIFPLPCSTNLAKTDIEVIINAAEAFWSKHEE